MSDEADLESCEELNPTDDLSGSEHEDFRSSSGTADSQHLLRQSALTILSRIFSASTPAALGLELTNKATAKRRRSSRLIRVTCFRPRVKA
jgi:hypothetical protein